MDIIGCPLILQNTAANSYGVDKESVSENLVKINVYYTSLNEKAVEDKIDYSFQVSLLNMTIKFAGWKFVQRIGRLSLPLARHLLLQPL